MIKRTYLIMCLAICSKFLVAQPVDLVNLIVGNKNSKVVYTGMDNFFRVNNFKSYKGIEPAVGVKLLDNKLLIVPQSLAPVTVKFIGKSGKRESLTFPAKRMPFILISIGEHTRTTVERSQLLNAKQIALKSSDPGDGYLEGYEVKRFSALINGEAFVMESNQFSPELLAAIEKSASEQKIIIGPVKAYNPGLDRTFNVDSKVAFTIK